jgi:CRP-like cAMP-binding protein
VAASGERRETENSKPLPGRNRILGALNGDEYARLVPHLTETPLEFKEVLHEQGDRIESVYFVEEGVVSLVTLLEDGEIETGTVGNEGMIGVHGFLGAEKANERAICQIPGRALRMPLQALQREPADGPLCQRLLRYINALMAMLAQTAACNRAHTLEQRMCRWLLMTLERVGREQFPLTQEFLAQMLGVRRPTVSLAGSALQRAGLIRYSRGRITIVDREGLEAMSCECHERIRRVFNQALGSGGKRTVHRARKRGAR